MRLIDAETFPNELKEMMIQIDKNRGETEENWFLHGFDEFVIAVDVIDLVKEMPTVDAVEVVRCKDCKYARNVWLSKTLSCDIWGDKFSPEDFCSTGKRRDKNETD